MNFKLVGFLVLAAVIFSAIFVATITSMELCVDRTALKNVGDPVDGGHPTTIFVGDPVDGGHPKDNRTTNGTG
ncbi:MAG TPA: hypothetical protein VMT26_01470 [Candidatus Bathyarchaeia archaeon]|jgi:hypothetical protein|nr:hypothetical protein [Candidatus Bathyarchaeia archaeon]